MDLITSVKYSNTYTMKKADKYLFRLSILAIFQGKIKCWKKPSGFSFKVFSTKWILKWIPRILVSFRYSILKA